MREAPLCFAREFRKMRILGLSLTALCCVLAAAPGVAQKAGSDTIAADQIDVGKVQARIVKYDQALGVVTQLARKHGENVECNAVCYLPSSSKPIAWRCAPEKKCDLQCTVNPPVGGCN
jgi:hypothetical protein